MSYDLKAEIFSPSSRVSTEGSVSKVFVSVGFLYLERVKVSSQNVIASARDANQLENVFRSRFHSGLTDNSYLQIGSVKHRIARLDEIPRRKGWMIYTQTTPT